MPQLYMPVPHAPLYMPQSLMPQMVMIFFVQKQFYETVASYEKQFFVKNLFKTRAQTREHSFSFKKLFETHCHTRQNGLFSENYPKNMFKHANMCF